MEGRRETYCCKINKAYVIEVEMKRDIGYFARKREKGEEKKAKREKRECRKKKSKRG